MILVDPGNYKICPKCMWHMNLLLGNTAAAILELNTKRAVDVLYIGISIVY